MNLLLPAAAIIALWAWTTGRWRTFRWGDLAAIVAGLLAVRLMTRGEWLPALVGLGWCGGWFWQGRRWAKRGKVTAPPAEARMPAEEARRLLDLPPGADAATVRAAHCRLIQRVHPDAGGSAELARRVNGARDILLADLDRGGSGAP